MRIKIALRNLFISQLFIFVFLIFAYLIWFPHSFSKLGGFYDTALMLIFVDVILGPLLVFIVYKKDKKHLNFDINVLLFIQLVAFIYGAYAMYLKHPTYNVFVNDRYKLVNASFSAPEKIQHNDLRSTFFSRPIMAYSELPKDENKLAQFMMGVDFLGEPDIDKRADFYKPHSQVINNILSKQLNKNELFKSSNSKKSLNKFLRKNGGKLSDYAFFPITGNNKKEIVFVLKATNGEAVGSIDINPSLLMTKAL